MSSYQSKCCTEFGQFMIDPQCKGTFASWNAYYHYLKLMFRRKAHLHLIEDDVYAGQHYDPAFTFEDRVFTCLRKPAVGDLVVYSPPGQLSHTNFYFVETDEDLISVDVIRGGCYIPRKFGFLTAFGPHYWSGARAYGVKNMPVYLDLANIGVDLKEADIKTVLLHKSKKMVTYTIFAYQNIRYGIVFRHDLPVTTPEGMWVLPEINAVDLTGIEVDTVEISAYLKKRSIQAPCVLYYVP